jgi:CubicO group peptidase (beta-lactamase class C family)
VATAFTVGDYMKFIRMVLNEGDGEHGRVLKPETAEAMAQNGLGEMKIKMLPGVIEELSNDAEFFPGMPKSWGYTFMINDEDAPTGRPAGELGWAGLPNLYFWIDRKNGLGGFWATQIFPFADPASFGGHMEFETAVYESTLSASNLFTKAGCSARPSPLRETTQLRAQSPLRRFAEIHTVSRSPGRQAGHPRVHGGGWKKVHEAADRGCLIRGAGRRASDRACC